MRSIIAVMDRAKTIIKRIWGYEISHLLVYSIVLNMIIECFNRRSLMGIVLPFTHPLIFFYNVMIIMTTMSIALLFKRRYFVCGVVSFVWLVAAVTNFIVLSSRKTPFTWMDMMMVNDAIKVMPLYLNVLTIIPIVAAIAFAVVLLVLVWKKAPVHEMTLPRKKFYLYSFIKIAIVVLVTYSLTTTYLLTGVLTRNFSNLAQAYKKYGFSYCFTSSVIGRGISKAKEYSSQYMDDLKHNLDDAELSTSDKTPNIIFVQLESFFDPTLVKGVKFSEDPIPNYHKLMGDYTSGDLSVPVFGAGTCNTEFEIQTGFNLDDFGPGEYPYKTIMLSTVCESTANNLKNLGYETHAIHNNDGTFYQRNKVFSHLGYETFTSIEYMSGVTFTPQGWAKDEILTEEIEKALNSSEGADYVFTISVQGHGDYPSVYPEGYEPEILISNFPYANDEIAFEYFVNQLHEMDTFIGELVEMLENRDEETVLVLYGDHLPTFEFKNEDLRNGDIMSTQFVVWNNIGIEREEVDLEAFQLSAYVLDKIGISEGYINKFHQLKHESEDYLKNLSILEYDILYGKKEIYGGTVPYEATDLRMGTEPITISTVYNYKNYTCVEGNNFTDYSVVMINGVEVTAEIISDQFIRIPLNKVKNGDELVVLQRGSDKIELSRITYKVESVDTTVYK